MPKQTKKTLLNWSTGRQNGSYFKKLVYQFKCFGYCFDCYLLKYVPGSFIQRHVDPVDDCSHYRLNIVLWAAERGGCFTTDSCIFRIGHRVILFRPDADKHAVSTVLNGNRYVLSFGYAKKVK